MSSQGLSVMKIKNVSAYLGEKEGDFEGMI